MSDLMDFNKKVKSNSNKTNVDVHADEKNANLQQHLENLKTQTQKTLTGDSLKLPKPNIPKLSNTLDKSVNKDIQKQEQSSHNKQIENIKKSQSLDTEKTEKVEKNKNDSENAVAKKENNLVNKQNSDKSEPKAVEKKQTQSLKEEEKKSDKLGDQTKKISESKSVNNNLQKKSEPNVKTSVTSKVSSSPKQDTVHRNIASINKPVVPSFDKNQILKQKQNKTENLSNQKTTAINNVNKATVSSIKNANNPIQPTNIGTKTINSNQSKMVQPGFGNVNTQPRVNPNLQNNIGNNDLIGKSVGVSFNQGLNKRTINNLNNNIKTGQQAQAFTNAKNFVGTVGKTPSRLTSVYAQNQKFRPSVGIQSTNPSIQSLRNPNLRSSILSTTTQRPGMPLRQQSTNNTNIRLSSKNNKKKPNFLAIVSKAKKFFIFGIILIVLGVGALQIKKMFFDNSKKSPSSKTVTTKTEQIELTYWGLWEDEGILKPAIDEFEKQNPNIKIKYVKNSPTEYLKRLRYALSSGDGPDIFRYHPSWIPILKANLATASDDIISIEEFKKSFYPVFSRALILDNKIYGIPLMYDGIAVFYNKQYFDMAGQTIPTNWLELRKLAQLLTIRKGSSIERAGLAIGNSSNIEHFSDILAFIIMQNKGSMWKPTAKETREAIDFYLNFYKKDKVWDADLPPSVVAFARGEVSMIFAPSWRAIDIVKMNPDIDFGVFKLPISGEQEPISIANFWVEGVSNNSTTAKQEASWKFLKFLSSKQGLTLLNESQKANRGYIEIPPRPDMYDMYSSDPFVSVFMEQEASAKLALLNSMTHDEAINDEIIQAYSKAIYELLNTSVESKQTKILNNLEQELTKIRMKYFK